MSAFPIIHKVIVYLDITHAKFRDDPAIRTVNLLFLLVFQGSKCTNSGFVLCKYAQYIPWEAIYMIILIQLGLFQYSMCYGNKREYVLSVVSHERYVIRVTNSLQPPPHRGAPTPPLTSLPILCLSPSICHRVCKIQRFIYIYYTKLVKMVYIGATRMIQFPLVALYPHQLLNITVSFVQSKYDQRFGQFVYIPLLGNAVTRLSPVKAINF